MTLIYSESYGSSRCRAKKAKKGLFFVSEKAFAALHEKKSEFVSASVKSKLKKKKQSKILHSIFSGYFVFHCLPNQTVYDVPQFQLGLNFTFLFP